jgi:tetratricopeptide (TPR) repeat protein
MTEHERPLANAEEALAEAQTLMQAGRLADAAILLDHVLARQPGDPVVLYLAGVSAHASGRFAISGRLLRSAEAVAPDAAEVVFALGNLHLDLGRAGASERFFRHALALSPGLDVCRLALAQSLERQHRYDDAATVLAALVAADPLAADAAIALASLRLRQDENANVRGLLRAAAAGAPGLARAHFLLADVGRRGGRIEAAATAYRRALALDAYNAFAWQGLGLILSAMSDADASRRLRTAIALAPADDVSWFALGEVARAREEWLDSVRHHRRTLACAPSRLDALIHLGNALDELDERVAAAAILRKALAGASGDPKVLSNLATVLLQDGEVGEARRLYRQAVSVVPADPVAHYNLGNADRQHLALADALGRYGRATDIDPGYATARWNDAITRLMAGDWPNGFARYEWRWRDGEHPTPAYAPWWEGEPLASRRIVLLGEQGFGDMIHFARYVRAVVENGGRVVLECYPPLRRLFSTLSPGIELIDVGASPGPVEIQAALMQLPLIFGSTPERTYAPIPYLAPPSEGPRLPGHRDGLKLGLVWAGNPRIEKFHKRSARLQDFVPLLGVSGVAVYSLQVGPRAADLAALGLAGEIVDLAPLVGDFADTAFLISQLDLVVAVDTAVAHLAGALGKPVWMLPTYVPDWRWLLGRDDTPWYPSMRLYRQAADRTWPPVVARIAGDLAALARSVRAN